MTTWIRMWEENGEVAIDATYAETIACAFDAWVERSVDGVLVLRTLSGDVYRTKASNIDSYLISSPEGRRRTLEIEHAQTEEERALRSDLGLPWKDD